MKNKSAVELGRLGGKATTIKKARASRENGKKGGRPKKQSDDCCEKCLTYKKDEVRDKYGGWSHIYEECWFDGDCDCHN